MNVVKSYLRWFWKWSSISGHDLDEDSKSYCPLFKVRISLLNFSDQTDQSYSGVKTNRQWSQNKQTYKNETLEWKPFLLEEKNTLKTCQAFKTVRVHSILCWHIVLVHFTDALCTANQRTCIIIIWYSESTEMNQTSGLPSYKLNFKPISRTNNKAWHNYKRQKIKQTYKQHVRSVRSMLDKKRVKKQSATW